MKEEWKRLCAVLAAKEWHALMLYTHKAQSLSLQFALAL